MRGWLHAGVKAAQPGISALQPGIVFHMQHGLKTSTAQLAITKVANLLCVVAVAEQRGRDKGCLA